MICVGARTQDHTMGLGPHMGYSTTSEEKTWVPKGFRSSSYGPKDV